MSFRRLIPALAVAGLMFALAVPAPAQKPFDDPVLERMRKDVFFLASPECEGRGIETKGINKAADYVADAFKAAGLKPAMKDGSYFQPFIVTTSAKLGQPTKAVLTGPADKVTDLKLGTDYNPMGFSPTSKVASGLVFVGYGITAPELKYDDYAGIDAAGKVVVMLRRTPRHDGERQKAVRPDSSRGRRQQPRRVRYQDRERRRTQGRGRHHRQRLRHGRHPRRDPAVRQPRHRHHAGRVPGAVPQACRD